MLPLPEKVRKNWAVMGYLFGLVRQIDPDLKFMVDTFTLVGFIWFSKRFLGLTYQIFSGKYLAPTSAEAMTTTGVTHLLVHCFTCATYLTLMLV